MARHPVQRMPQLFRRLFAVVVSSCLLAGSALADPFQLVQDINPGTLPALVPHLYGPRQYVALANMLVFAAGDPATGMELWLTEGSVANTRMLVHFAPDVVGDGLLNFKRVGDIAYFAAADASHGRELWSTDGTLAGTHMVKDINPGTASSLNLQSAIGVGGVLYFAADDGVHGSELWRSDGTAAGTFMVQDLEPLAGFGSGPSSFSDLGGTVLFSAFVIGLGSELWRTDGTAGGTALVADILPGPSGSSPERPVVVGNTVYFVADDGVHGDELWKSNGTTAGTSLVKDVRPGALGASPLGGYRLVRLGSQVLFSADDGVHGSELWRSDGTSAGTVLLGDITPSGTSAVQDLEAFGTFALFSAGPVPGSLLLYRTDGTPGGTTLVKAAPPDHVTDFVSFGSGIFFFARGATNLGELWRTDGTAAGTALVSTTGKSFGYVGNNLIATEDRLYFTMGATPGQLELWVSDGVTTTPLQDTMLPGANSFPNLLTRSLTAGGISYFDADDGVHGRELWRSDGTPAGTALVKDIVPGPGSGSPRLYAALGDLIIFIAETPAEGAELWVSDGTDAGTHLLRDITPGPAGGVGMERAVWRGRLYFVTAVPGHGDALWATDGTEAGTVVILQDAPWGLGGSPVQLTPTDGDLFFVADDGAHGLELWHTDGTAAGTTIVKDIWPGFPHSDPQELAAFGSRVVFRAYEPSSGEELWSSDGTAAGTTLLKDINPTSGSSPHSFCELGGEMYFFAYPTTAATLIQLWRTDGTATGTRLVGTGGKGFLVAAGGQLFFVGTDPAHGDELWRSDGTPEGTRLVKDIRPGTAGTPISEPVAVNDQLLFHADDGINGSELWSSEGTPAGTVMVQDLFPGTLGGTPVFMGVHCPNLLFAATTPALGRELWSWAPSGSTSTLHTLYRDADGDGYGQRPALLACRTLPGYAALAGDCDDLDPAIHPNAPDGVCNGVDNDCNGVVDNGTACSCIEHAPGLTGWWKGESNALDEKANGNGSWTGAASYAAGRVGQAFSFGGSSYVSLGDPAAFEFTTGMTAEAWVNLAAGGTGGTRNLIGKWSSNTQSGVASYALAVNGGVLQASVSGDGTASVTLSGPVLASEVWTHVAMTFDNGTLRLYVDGIPAGSLATGVPSLFSTGTAPLTFARSQTNNQHLRAALDEPAVYDHALTAAEIAAIFDAGAAGMCGLGVLVDAGAPRVPARFAVAPAWPNPARAATNVRFALPEARAVRAEVYDVAGRRVATLIAGQRFAAGEHLVSWDGRDANGARVSPGIYQVRVATGPDVAVRRIVRVE